MLTPSVGFLCAESLYSVAYPASVAAAIAGFFAILGNKLCQITKIFEELDHIKS